MRFESHSIRASHSDSQRHLMFELLVLMAMLFVALCSAPSSSAQASDVYITPDGSGQGVCTNSPQTPAWFNNSGNWGTGANQIGPGTTVHLCGTFTGAAGATLLTFQGNGASGNPVTLLFEAGATLTAPYWGSTGSAAINTNGKSNLVIDGGSNGTIQNTANGTGLANQQASSAVHISGASNVTVQHLTVANICQHNSTSDTVACNSGGNNDRAVYISGGATNVTITLNTIHDSQNCIEYSGSGSDTGILISKNTVYHCNWGFGGYGATNGLTIDGNDISSATNWDTGADSFHHNGVMLFPQSSNMNNVVISNNYIHDINGTETAHIFLDPNSPGDLPGVLIYNNVLTTTTLNGPTNAFITVGRGVSNGKVYNNTVSGKGAQGMSGQIDTTFEDNIVVGTFTGIELNSGYTSITSNFNVFFNLTGGSQSMTAGSTSYPTVPAWHTGTGLDANSQTGDPKLASNYTLGSGSSAIGSFANLTSLGIQGLNIGAPQSFGVNFSCGAGCVPRPAGGTWDIGAYPSSASAGQGPNPPTGLTAQVQ